MKSRHALDCGLSCGLAECDCGVDKQIRVPANLIEEAIELLSDPKRTLNRAGVVVALRGLLERK